MLSKLSLLFFESEMNPLTCISTGGNLCCRTGFLSGIAVSVPEGDFLYIADSGNGRVLQYEFATATTTTLPLSVIEPGYIALDMVTIGLYVFDK